VEKLRKLFAYFLVFGIVMSIANCANEEINTSQDAKIFQAKEWFESYKNNEIFHPAFKDLQYKWTSASKIKLENDSIVIAVPLKDKIESSEYKGEKILYLYPLEKGYNAVVQELFPDSKDINSEDKKGTGLKKLDSYSGYIITWSLKGYFLSGAKFENNVLINYIEARFLSKPYVTNLTGKEAQPILLDEVLVYGGGGPSNPIGIRNDFSIGGVFEGSGAGSYLNNGGGAGNNNSNSASNNTVIYAPPSCESFNFVKNGALWQAAMVKNINFKVVGISPKGIEILHVLSYPQAIYFGAPTNIKIGNTNITPGIAANLSARALQQSMKDVISKYGATDVSDLILDRYFRERLAYNYPLYVPGGRVNFNSTENLPAVNYKTNTFTAGDCN
jgi:hypothetical protein